MEYRDKTGAEEKKSALGVTSTQSAKRESDCKTTCPAPIVKAKGESVNLFGVADEVDKHAIYIEEDSRALHVVLDELDELAAVPHSEADPLEWKTLLAYGVEHDLPAYIHIMRMLLESCTTQARKLQELAGAIRQRSGEAKTEP